jgi:hypothetical protein
MVMHPADLELAQQALVIDPDRSNIVLAVGKKGSGKSEAGHLIFNTWPYDRAILDITGDARPDDPYAIPVVQPFGQLEEYRPLKEQLARAARLPWPAPDGDRLTLWIRISPDQGADTPEKNDQLFRAAQDNALKLGLYPQHNPMLWWADEFGRMFKKGGSGAGPSLALALQSSRHFGPLSLILTCPRPRHIDPLTVQQADLVLIYELANADDREVIAKNIGYPLAEFERAYFACQQRNHAAKRAGRPELAHHFLLYHAGLGRLFDMPPLPIEHHHGGRA